MGVLSRRDTLYECVVVLLPVDEPRNDNENELNV